MAIKVEVFSTNSCPHCPAAIDAAQVAKDKMGDVVPVEVYIYDDRSFDFKVKTPPAAFLIKKAAGVKKASSTGSKDIVGSLTKDQVRQIAETKLPDLNAYDVEAAMKIVAGTAKNMGINIQE